MTPLLFLLSLSLTAQAAVTPTPRHEVSFVLGLANSPPAELPETCNSWWCYAEPADQDNRPVGSGVAYHYLLPVGPVWLGAGGSFEWMGNTRDERLAALTAVVEYQPGRRRVRPVARLEAGASLPIGGPEQAISDRSVGPLVHPSVGLAIDTGSRRSHEILLTAGYRFANANFSAVSRYGWPAARAVKYQRLTFTLASRF